MGGDDTGAEPAKEPSSEPSSETTGGTTGGETSGGTSGGGDPVTYILTQYWAGDMSIAEDGSASGWESYDLN